MPEEEPIPTQPADYRTERMIARFAIGASAGALGGLIGGTIAYEVVTQVLHQSADALTMIGGPTIGVAAVTGYGYMRH